MIYDATFISLPTVLHKFCIIIFFMKYIKMTIFQSAAIPLLKWKNNKLIPYNWFPMMQHCEEVPSEHCKKCRPRIDLSFSTCGMCADDCAWRLPRWAQLIFWHRFNVKISMLIFNAFSMSSKMCWNIDVERQNFDVEIFLIKKWCFFNTFSTWNHRQNFPLGVCFELIPLEWWNNPQLRHLT